ncbi:MAG: NAD-dependent epimerase/dehydratase family protein [Bryobacteraceae bacterium]
MRILLIGATGFIGSQVLRELAGLGHEICVFHRGITRPPIAVDEIIGDRNDLPSRAGEFRQFRPDAVVDFVLSDGKQARQLVEVFRGVTARMVAISSGDVYRAAGILHGAEQGPLQPVPLTEESDLRTVSKFYPPENIAQLKALFPWVTPDYDKIAVERAVMGNSDLPGTVLRLPMVYGPRDPLHRLFPYLKRMDDRRAAILLQDDIAAWRGSRGYVKNVAAAIALATISDRAAGRIYNVADRETLCEADWVRKIGSIAHWNGAVIPLSKDTIPPHLRMPSRNEQHWEMSSTRIRKELGFQEPVEFTTALERTIAWERAHPPDAIDPKQFDYPAEDAALRGASAP